MFSGTYGYARPNQLALFQGTRIGLDGFELRREGGDFGLSAAANGGDRRADRGPQRRENLRRSAERTQSAAASVSLDGKPIPHTMEQNAVAFSIDIAQKDGLKHYEITF